MRNSSANGASDRFTIDPADPLELECWSKRLNVTEDQLKKAIVAAGTRADDVRRYLWLAAASAKGAVLQQS